MYPRYVEATGEQKKFFENTERIDFKIRIYQTTWINGSRDGEKEVFSYTLSKDNQEIKNITQKTHIYKQFTFDSKVTLHLRRMD